MKKQMIHLNQLIFPDDSYALQHDSADRNLQNHSQHRLEAQEERFIRKIAKTNSCVIHNRHINLI